VDNSSGKPNLIPANIYATLINDEGTVIESVLINPNGTFAFASIIEGIYNVLISTNQGSTTAPSPLVELPAGWVSTGEFNGPENSGADTDVDGTSELISLTTDFSNINFGIVKPGQVGGKVMGLDGSPIANAVLTLIDNNPATNDPTFTTTTDGIYNFENLNPGEYIILETNPPGLNSRSDSQSIDGDTTPNTNTNDDSIPVTVGEGENDFDNDFTDASGALPIDLLDFKAKKHETSVILNWKVANEVGFSHFEIQKSNNGKEFGYIGTMSSTNSKFYSFTDKNPTIGENYYRLKMIDFDGSTKISNILNLKINSEFDYINIENPAIDYEFQVNTNTENVEFSLLNSQGKIVDIKAELINRNTFRVKSSTKISGIYYLSIKTNSNIQTRKVVFP
jgi:hypothetical protein